MTRTTKTTAKKKATEQAPYVIVRTTNAGVHVGTLSAKTATEVRLTGARRVWRWYGANTLHEMSLAGVAANSRVSQPVDAITLNGWIEILPCTPAARANLEAAKWAP